MAILRKLFKDILGKASVTTPFTSEMFCTSGVNYEVQFSCRDSREKYPSEYELAGKVKGLWSVNRLNSRPSTKCLRYRTAQHVDKSSLLRVSYPNLVYCNCHKKSSKGFQVLPSQNEEGGKDYSN